MSDAEALPATSVAPTASPFVLTSNSSPMEASRSPAMSAAWVRFAATGDPNGGKLVKWPKFDAASRAYMDFTDAGPVVKEGLRRQACDVFMENQKRQAK